ncbi:MAG: tRNA(Ile)-lysidine synthase [Hyphomicrobiaceae bacterium]|jgi:tRNA(Ile)-lysidine synthase
MSVCDACSIPGSVLDAGAAGDDEAGLRKARYAALREHAADHRLPWIATAHTRDDQVETILFRLARGTGRRGLSGISPVRNGLLRPLLDASRQELRDFLQRRQLAYCEDSSNDSDRYARNRIRHTVVPAFREALGEDALDRVPAMARRWRLDEEYLGSEVERFTIWCERGPKGELDLAALDQCPLPLRGRILRRWFERRDGRPTLGVAEIEILEGLVIAAPHAQIDLGTLHVARAPGRLTASRR